MSIQGSSLPQRSTPVGDNLPGFQGSWSNYPFFDSGLIVVSACVTACSCCGSASTVAWPTSIRLRAGDRPLYTTIWLHMPI
jgi:hypothetical protein